jgi:type III pantothenate kinase
MMLLVVDVGNTNTVLGVYETSHPGFAGKAASPRLLANWRVATVMTHTVDEYGVLFRNLFAIGEVDATEVRGIIISSVVPPMDSTLREVCERYFELKPLFVEPGIKTGMPVLYENPQEVGADRMRGGGPGHGNYI